MAKYEQNNPNCWQSCSWCSLDIGYQEVLCSVDKFYLLIPSLHLFQLFWLWMGKGELWNVLYSLFSECLRGFVREEWLLFKILEFWGGFLALHLFDVLQILMIGVFQWDFTCSGEPPKSLAARNAVLPSTSGITLCFLNKILAFDLIKREAFSCYLSAGFSRQCGKPGWWMNSLKWNLCLASVSINRLGFFT